MSVTVEVRGVPTGGGGAPAGGDSSSGGGASGRTGAFLPADERMITDIRREMQSRGVLLIPGSQGMQQIINDYRKQALSSVNEDITQRFQGRRAELSRSAEARYEEIDRQLNDYYREGLQSSSPQERQRAQEALEAERQRKYEWIGKEIDEAEKRLNEEEEVEKSNSEDKLSEALNRLTETLERESQGASSDSYIGRLRFQQRELLKKREEAPNEAEAISASRQLADVNERLRRVMGGENNNQVGLLNAMGGMNSFLSSAGGGNLGGMISGLGNTGIGIATALGGLSLGTAAGALGAVGLIAALGAAVQGSGERYNELSTLAAFRGTTGIRDLSLGGKFIGPLIRQSTLGDNGEYHYSALGMSETDFAKEAERRIRARGMSEDWFNETYRQIGLEKNYALRAGALMNAGTYDRYGIAGTEAVVRLVDMLTRIQNSGVSSGDYTRIQEKLDIQQQIMASYMSRVDRPDYDMANRAVAAMSAVRGITQDTRIGSDYASMQRAIQNPMNDRMKALIYGTVEDIIPGTKGRMDLIDLALRDDKNEGKILQAVIQRISSMYGGMDTTMGYYAFKSVFPNIAPERLMKYVQELGNPESEASKILMGEIRGTSSTPLTDSLGRKRVDTSAAEGTGVTSEITEALRSISGDVHEIWDAVVNQKIEESRQMRSGGWLYLK